MMLLRIMVKQCIDQSARLIARTRMHDHTDRLIDDQHFIIFIDHIDVYIFWLICTVLLQGRR